MLVKSAESDGQVACRAYCCNDDDVSLGDVYFGPTARQAANIGKDQLVNVQKIHFPRAAYIGFTPCAPVAKGGETTSVQTSSPGIISKQVRDAVEDVFEDARLLSKGKPIHTEFGSVNVVGLFDRSGSEVLHAYVTNITRKDFLSIDPENGVEINFTLGEKFQENRQKAHETKMTALEKRISSLAFNPPPRTTISSSNSRDRDSDRLSPGGSVSVEEKK